MEQVHRNYESEKFKLYLRGSSRDLRTNAWTATCKKCNKQFDPPTTMMRFNNIVCTKCNESEIIDYNHLKQV